MARISGITIEKDEHNPEFVAKIKNAEKGESNKIDFEKYGISYLKI